MKIVPNKLLTTSLTCLMIMLTLTPSFATSGSVNQNPPPPTPPPPGLPIDSGLVILLFAGLLLAYYKYRIHQHTKKTLK